MSRTLGAKRKAQSKSSLTSRNTPLSGQRFDV
jgi:hypothetical protein